jgi:hypothetical protein
MGSRHDRARCINCGRKFGSDTRHYFGAGEHDVGPFCSDCDRVIKVHTKFVDAHDSRRSDLEGDARRPDDEPRQENGKAQRRE